MIRCGFLDQERRKKSEQKSPLSPLSAKGSAHEVEHDDAQEAKAKGLEKLQRELLARLTSARCPLFCMNSTLRAGFCWSHRCVTAHSDMKIGAPSIERLLAAVEPAAHSSIDSQLNIFEKVAHCA